MKLAKPLLDENGNVLLRAGNTLTPTVHKRLNSMELQGLYVEDEYSRDIEPIDLIEPQMRLDAMKALMKGDLKKAIKFAEEVADELYDGTGFYSTNLDGIYEVLSSGMCGGIG